MANYRPNQLPPSQPINKNQDVLVIDQGTRGVNQVSVEGAVTSVISQQQINKINTSVQSVNGAAPGSNGEVYVNADFIGFQRSRAYASLQSYGDNVQFIQTAGYYEAGDGGEGLYSYSPTEPWHGGKFQSADGKWWVLDISKGANVLAFGAIAIPVSESVVGKVSSASAIRAAADTGKNVIFPEGKYLWDATEEPDGLILTAAGQGLIGAGPGKTTGHYNDWGRDYKYKTSIVFYGTGNRVVRTRRFHRSSASDPTDPPYSAGLTMANDGQFTQDINIDLYCDYSDTNRYNEGSDWDIAVHNMCRTGIYHINTSITGYWRLRGFYRENTSLDKSLQPFADYVIPDRKYRGTDGTTYINCYWRGPRQGAVTLGAIKRITGYNGDNPIFDPQYYDEISGGLVSDVRGSFGASDETFFACRMYGPDHHSGYRRAQPRPDMDYLLEPEDAPCVYWNDGWANNSTDTLDAVNQGVVFCGRNRVETIEAFHIRLGRCGRITIDTHFDYAGYNDPEQATVNYGSITAQNETREVFIAPGCNSNPRSDYFKPRTWANMAPTTGNTMLQNVNATLFRARDEGTALRLRQRPGQPIRFEGEDANYHWAIFPSGNLAPRLNNTALIGSSGASVAQGFIVIVRTGINGEFADTGGTGSPEGVVFGAKGSTWRRSDGGAGTCFYVKETETGNVGWAAK